MVSPLKNSARSLHEFMWPSALLAVCTLILVNLSCVPATTGDGAADPRPTLGGGLDGNGSGDDIFNLAGSLSFGASPSFCCDPLKIEFEAELGPGIPLAGVSFLWTFGDDRSAVGAQVTHTYSWPGQYEVRLTAVMPLGPTLTTSGILALTVDGAGGIEVIVTPAPPLGSDPNDPQSAGGGIHADAGPDQTVTSGDLVTLDGTGSQGAPNPPLKYSWINASGLSVDLSADDQPVVTFEAPMVTSPQTMTFVLVVSQGPLEDADQVRIRVEPFLDPAGESSSPQVFDQSLTISSLQALSLSLHGDDLDGDDLTFTIVDQPIHGTLGPIDNTQLESASVTYIPTPGFQGMDSLTFIASDGALESNVGSITFNVLAEGRAPEARDDEWLGQVGRAMLIPLVGHDEDGDSLDFVIDGISAGGTLGDLLPNTPQSSFVLFTPNPGFEGEVTVRFHVEDLQFESEQATVTIAVRKAFLPWREINLPDQPATDLYTAAQGAQLGMTVLDFGLIGLEEWSRITNDAIITTVITNIPYVYPDLMDQRPEGMRIIGGFKTVNIPGASPYNSNLYEFTNPAAWQQIAAAAQQTVSITGTNIVVLENETTLTPFYQHLETIDYSLLQQSLAPLRDSGIEYWWWLPVILHDWSGFPDRVAQTTAFVDALKNAVPNSKFMTAYSGWHLWETDVDAVDRQYMIDTLGLARMQEGLYVAHGGYWPYTNEAPLRCFTPTEALSPTGPLSGDRVRIYPPGGDWILVAQGFNAVLPPLGSIVGN